jgi:hypothetical protein
VSCSISDRLNRRRIFDRGRVLERALLGPGPLCYAPSPHGLALQSFRSSKRRPYWRVLRGGLANQPER